MVSVICLYFGSWPWVQDKALLDVAEFALEKSNANLLTVHPNLQTGRRNNATISIDMDALDFSEPFAPMPFVVSVEQWDLPDVKQSLKTAAYSGRKYYVWLFGLKVRLPYEGPPRQRTSRHRISFVVR